MAEDLTSAVRARELTRAFGSFARARALFRGVSLANARARETSVVGGRARGFSSAASRSIDRATGGGARGIGSDGSDGADVFDGSAVTSRARGMVD